MTVEEVGFWRWVCFIGLVGPERKENPEEREREEKF